jgi:hypothetical protein
MPVRPFNSKGSGPAHIHNRPPTPEEVAEYRTQWLARHKARVLPASVTPLRSEYPAMKQDHYRGAQWDTTIYMLDPGGSVSLRRALVGK